MLIGGLQKFTFIDYPGKLACVVFLAGCNFRCPFCYNREIVLAQEIKKHPLISEREIFKFLKERKNLLEGVVITGGEPCLNKGLLGFIKKAKKLGYLVKIDTNGSFPEMLRYLIAQRLVDYVAMDIKASKEKYKEITGGRADLRHIERSVSLLKENRVDYEFRSTVAPTLLDKKDVLEIARWISGAKRYYLQNFRPEKTLNPKFEKIKPYSQNYLLKIQKSISPFFEICQLR
ncbi:MAG: anaerobic ribonucleoside-triphosphate reductase activating protein [Candidatus Nealsonbacteria bacterium]|nr:anaerobic ribonucleoside-triphosphate reductase activating protein [Candidatus Nealsonbacteria bacterium]